jgi:cell division protein FtsB
VEFEDNQGFQDNSSGLDLVKLSTFLLVIGLLVTGWGWYNAEKEVDSLENQNNALEDDIDNLDSNVSKLEREIGAARSNRIVNHSFKENNGLNITEFSDLTENDLIFEYNLNAVSIFNRKAQHAIEDERYKEAAAYYRISSDFIDRSITRLRDSKKILDDDELRESHDRMIEADKVLREIQEKQVKLMYAYAEGDEEKEQRIEQEIAELRTQYDPEYINTDTMSVLWFNKPLDFGRSEFE